jgi:Ca2+-binding RTX toxin-like protein
VLSGAVGRQGEGIFEGATAEPGEPVRFGETIWYSWTAPADGTYSFSTLGSASVPDVFAWTGSAVENLTRVARNRYEDSYFCCAVWLPLDAQAGTTYSFQLIERARTGESGLTLGWRPLILGTPGDDVLVGTPGDDEIRGLGGADVILGGAGDDLLLGGEGDDVLRGEGGNDHVRDWIGADFLRGGPGTDRLHARDWDDDGPDRLWGGADTDRCRADRFDSRRGCP